MSIKERVSDLRKEIPTNVILVAVSKTYPPEDIMQAYDAGQRIFGENRPQELRAKQEALPGDVRWHMIGNLQTNKVKYIAPFVELIHSVDSDKLLAVINKEAEKNERTIDVLMEVCIAQEETKHGWEPAELEEYLSLRRFAEYPNIRVRGLMGMASLTDDMQQVRQEFDSLKELFDRLATTVFDGDNAFDTLSMGMTSDWKIAVECGSTMVRIGSRIFGERNYEI